MNDVDVLVFSKDRACQLDLLLRSVDRYASHLYRSIVVLWTASSRDFGRGYARCFADHAGATFELEHAFEEQVHAFIADAHEWLSFLCDDDVFYAVAPSELSSSSLPLSLRGGDYDYPFSLDGNVYLRADVATVIAGERFRNPTELEAAGHENRRRLPFTSTKPWHPPCLTGLPLNRVSRSSGMPHLDVHEYDLNERYLEGLRLPVPLAGDYAGLPAHSHELAQHVAALELAS